MIFDIQKYFGKVKHTALELDAQRRNGAIYLMSLDNEESGVVGGQIAVLSNAQVAATHVVNRCHRPATDAEVEAFYAEHRAKAIREKQEEMSKQIRYNLVVNAPDNWRTGEPLPVDVPAAAFQASAPANKQRQNTRDPQHP